MTITDIPFEPPAEQGGAQPTQVTLLLEKETDMINRIIVNKRYLAWPFKNSFMMMMMMMMIIIIIIIIAVVIIILTIALMTILIAHR